MHIYVRAGTAGYGNVPAITDSSVNIARVKTFPALEERDIALEREREKNEPALKSTHTFTVIIRDDSVPKHTVMS